MNLTTRTVSQQTLSAPHYPYSGPPAPGRTVEVAPGVFWLRMPLPWALDHVNAWLLRDGDGWIVVDTGRGSNETRALWQRVFDDAHEDLPITSVIATHFHPDHVGLASWLTERFQASFWMTATEYLTGQALPHNLSHYSNDAVNAMFRRHGLDDACLGSLGNRNETYRRDVGDLPASFRRLKDGDQIDIGGRVWRVIVGYGHAPEHASLYCAANNVLIAGDMVLPRISPNISVWPAEQDGDPLWLFSNRSSASPSCREKRWCCRVMVKFFRVCTRGYASYNNITLQPPRGTAGVLLGSANRRRSGCYPVQENAGRSSMVFCDGRGNCAPELSAGAEKTPSR